MVEKLPNRTTMKWLRKYCKKFINFEYIDIVYKEDNTFDVPEQFTMAKALSRSFGMSKESIAAEIITINAIEKCKMLKIINKNKKWRTK